MVTTFWQTFWSCLVETIAKSQALQTAGQSDILQALVANIGKSQTLQTIGQSHILQNLVETKAKSQALQTVGGKVTFSRVWLKS